MREVAGEKIISGEGISQINFNKLISLNKSAAYIWEKVKDKEFDTETVAALLMEKYGIDRHTAMEDSASLLQQWKELGLAGETD